MPLTSPRRLLDPVAGIPLLSPGNWPRLMGVINVTPDSFYEHTRTPGRMDALARAESLVGEGADILDVGGESTRPGADPVPADVERDRVLPVVREVVRRFPHVPVSVDTAKPEVAQACLDAGAAIINDVAGLANVGMAKVLKNYSVPVIVMHSRGTPKTMQNNPVYDDVVADIRRFFEERMTRAEDHGIARDRLWLDPGIGFAKTTAHNLEILRRLPDLAAPGRPLVVGLSRKSFIGRALGSEAEPVPPDQRAEGTLAGHLWAARRGAHVLRVHDMLATRRLFAMWRALEGESTL